MGEGGVRLFGVKQVVPKSELKPVAVGGVADRWIYYDKKVAATFLFDDEKYEGSSRDYTYYLDALGRMDDGGRTYKEMIGRKRLMYVHEVQHWLRKKDKREDGLEINEGKL